jgi:uncharacterized membrane protein HdeD (DUF308 family)
MDGLARAWTVWIVRGVASIIFGLLTIWRPGASIAALVLVFGSYSLADGALLLGFAFRYTKGRKAPYVVRGLLSVAAGAVAFLYPGLTAISLYILIGAWAITAGAAELAVAFGIRKEASSVRGLVFAGFLSIAFGAALLALPIVGVIVLTSLIAAYGIVNGIFLISAGVRIHAFARPLSAA